MVSTTASMMAICIIRESSLVDALRNAHIPTDTVVFGFRRPITTTYPASEFVGVDQSILYDNLVVLETTAGILDTGTTLILIASGMHFQHVSVLGQDSACINLSQTHLIAIST